MESVLGCTEFPLIIKEADAVIVPGSQQRVIQ